MAAAVPTASTDGPSGRTRPSGMPTPLLADDDQARWRKRIEQAKQDRRRFEPDWRLNLAFAAGKMWLEWRPFGRGGRFILPRLGPGEYRYTVDKITDARMTVLGQFSMDDDRPQVLFRSDDLPTQDFAEIANDAVAAGWETEWLGDRVLLDVKRTVIDLGSAAARCRFDPTAGPARIKQVPHDEYGQPILDPDKATAYVADRQAAGESANLKTIHEGRIRWDHGTPFNCLVPAGIKREEKFPWEGWIEPVHVDKVLEQYGSRAVGLKAEAIDDVYSLGGEAESSAMGSSEGSDSGAPTKLEDHVFVYTIYERPNRQHPDGRVLVFAGASLRCLEVRDKLPYVAPDGTRRSGIHYFHYVRLTDRFWSRGLLDLIREGQKVYNKRRSQIGETIDRGQPFILYEEGAKPKRRGVPVEMIGLPKQSAPPVVSSGVPVGDWMYKEIEQIAQDMQDASGLQDVLQGQNPSNVGNYSQLALLQEQAGTKFNSIFGSFKDEVGHMVEDSVYDIRTYWGKEKLLAVVGPEGQLKAFTFDASKTPSFYRVYVAKGAAQPRSQAAQLKKVDDMATFAINSGAAAQDPNAYLGWLKESYEAGAPVALPEASRHDQLDKALLENAQLEQKVVPAVAYYDDHALHVTVHRSVQARADAGGDPEVSAACEQHIQAHLAEAQAQATATQGGPLAGAPGAAAAPPAADAGGPPHPSPFSLFLGSSTGGRSNFGI